MPQVVSLETLDRLLCQMEAGNWRERVSGCPVARVFILRDRLAAVYPFWWDGARRLPSLLPSSVGIRQHRHAIVDDAPAPTGGPKRGRS